MEPLRVRAARVVNAYAGSEGMRILRIDVEEGLANPNMQHIIMVSGMDDHRTVSEYAKRRKLNAEIVLVNPQPFGGMISEAFSRMRQPQLAERIDRALQRAAERAETTAYFFVGTSGFGPTSAFLDLVQERFYSFFIGRQRLALSLIRTPVDRIPSYPYGQIIRNRIASNVELQQFLEEKGHELEHVSVLVPTLNTDEDRRRIAYFKYALVRGVLRLDDPINVFRAQCPPPDVRDDSTHVYVSLPLFAESPSWEGLISQVADPSFENPVFFSAGKFLELEIPPSNEVVVSGAVWAPGEIVEDLRNDVVSHLMSTIEDAARRIEEGVRAASNITVRSLTEKGFGAPKYWKEARGNKSGKARFILAALVGPFILKAYRIGGRAENRIDFQNLEALVKEVRKLKRGG